MMGHLQVIDAYLAAAASHRGGRIATFDRRLAQFRPAVTELID